MSANWHGIFALTGRAHCQHQVAFLIFFFPIFFGKCFILFSIFLNVGVIPIEFGMILV